MARFVECTELLAGGSINVNFDNVETVEKVEQNGRIGTKITFVSGRYIVVTQPSNQLNDIINAAPA